MTVSAQNPVAVYTANGVTTDFSLPAKVLISADLKVYLNDVLQVGGYSVSGIGNDGGVTVSFSAAPSSGTSVLLKRDLDISRTTDYPFGGKLSSDVLDLDQDRQTMMLQQLDESIGRALVVDPGVSVDLGLPSPSANQLIGWNANADGLENKSPVSGDVVVAADVSFQQAGYGAVTRDVQSKMREIVSVMDFGAVGDGVTDDTAAVLSAMTAAIGKRLLFPTGTYVWDSVVVPGSVEIVCDPGVVFKRKAGADGAAESYWNAGAAMLEIEKNGITLSVSDFTYDGNSANQTTTEPTGWFIRTKPPAAIGGDPITLRVKRGVFTGGTSGYLLLRGDDVNRRYKTFAYVDDCRFYDTVYGKGKGDPSTPNPLGYNPTYVLVMDYVQVRTNNFHAEFNAATGTGQYAATAINGTFFGAVYANSGESSLFLHGTTYLKGMGRSAKKYDDADWVTNNGIGAIDCYGNADTLFVENVVGVDCENVAVRAKGSLKMYTVLSATLTNCHRGLQVGPSTTGACETVVRIGSVRCDGGTIPQLEFVGNSAVDGIPSVTVDSVFVSGTMTNPEGLSNQGAVRFRYVSSVNGRGIGVYGSPLRGIEAVDVKRCNLTGITVNATTSGEGIYVSGGDIFTLYSFDIRNTSGVGISVNSNTKDVVLDGGRTESTANYGVFCNTTTSNLFVNKVSVDTVSGTGRGFYAGGGYASFTNCTSTGAATPLFVVAGTRKREENNSWNAAVNYGSAAPVSGSWVAGDVVYNTSPVAGGTIGWVCTAAGTPGTWKTFGAISA